jgi:hypothetical protein
MASSPGSPVSAVVAAHAAPGLVAYRRHPLGLPAGSVRALLAFMVFGIIWAMLLLPEEQAVPIPLYVYYLMFLILGHYFAVRSHPSVAGVREHPPLYLPRGSLRLLMILGFAAALGWGYYRNPNFFDRLNPAAAADSPAYLPLVLLGAFFLGVLMARVGQHLLADPVQGVPYWFQDVLAWLSLLAMLGMIAEFLIHLVINPSLALDRQLHLPHWEGFLAGLVAFYFGARS